MLPLYSFLYKLYLLRSERGSEEAHARGEEAAGVVWAASPKPPGVILGVRGGRKWWHRQKSRFSQRGWGGSHRISLVFGGSKVLSRCLLSCQSASFVVLGLETTGFSQDLFCLCLLMFWVPRFWGAQSGIYKARRQPGGAYHIDIPWVPRPIAILLFCLPFRVVLFVLGLLSRAFHGAYLR